MGVDPYFIYGQVLDIAGDLTRQLDTKISSGINAHADALYGPGFADLSSIVVGDIIYDTATGTIRNAHTKIVNAVDPVLDDLIIDADEIRNNVTHGTKAQVDAVVGGTDAASQTIIQTITGTADISAEVAARLKDDIERLVSENLRRFERDTDSVWATALDWFSRFTAPLDEVVLDAIQSVLGQGPTIFERVQGILNEQELTILGNLRHDLDVAVADADDILGVIPNLIAEQLEPHSTTLAELTRRADLITEGPQAWAGLLLPGIGTLLDPIADKLDATLADGFRSVMTSFFGELSPEVRERIDPLLRIIEDDPDIGDEIKALTAPGLLPLGAVGGLMAGFALPMILSSMLTRIMEPPLTKVAQKMSAVVRETIFPISDLAGARHRGLIDADRFENQAAKGGWTDQDQTVALEMLKLRPATIELVDYWRRDLIDEAQLDSDLKLLGWSGEYRALLRKAAYPPPGVQDLITMAVREVFTPAIAESFGQFEDIPDAFMAHAKTVGISDEWARNYWAAHWALPSVQQGFEMLHRGEVGMDALDNLLRASDVMPFWREPLKAIAYRPYTRVDVRRMHKLGVLDHDQVIKSYMDLGFDPEKAEAMTNFTELYNAGSERPDPEPQRDLTKGDILGMLNDGVFDQDETSTMLQTLGFDADESLALIAREQLQELRGDRKADISDVVDRTKAGALDYEGAQLELIALDTTDRERSKALRTIERALQSKLRGPSKADLDSWYERELIDLVEYGDELRQLGYSERYVILYQAEASAEQIAEIAVAEERAARAAQPRIETKGQLDRLYQQDILDLDEYRVGLSDIGYADSSIENFVTAILLKVATRKELEAEQAAIAAETPTRSQSKGQLDRLYRWTHGPGLPTTGNSSIPGRAKPAHCRAPRAGDCTNSRGRARAYPTAKQDAARPVVPARYHQLPALQ